MSKVNLKIGVQETVTANLLNPSDINRAIDEAHVERFEEKLTRNEWLDPIKVDNQYNILEGHHRYYAALNLKQEVVPVYKCYWLDNLTEKERLQVILQYNASNLNWKNEDYLEKYAEIDNGYNYVYQKWKKYSTNLTVGTVLSIYMVYDSSRFKAGECNLRGSRLADYLADRLSNFVKKYGKAKAQSYSLREIVKVCHKASSMTAVEYILKRYDDMLLNNHSRLTSIAEFRPHINDVLSEYIKITND